MFTSVVMVVEFLSVTDEIQQTFAIKNMGTERTFLY